ncbi:MAG: hypothetical protein Q8S41_12800, partial [Lutibacter sp.]|nr:hypothetical protein [Lutibacter sp.]
TERRSNTVQRPTSNERTSQVGNNTERRANTVQRPTSNERTSQAGNNTERRSNTVDRPSQNERSANTGRMAENRAPERTAQKTERTQTVKEVKGNSGKNENSKGNSSRRN